MLRNIQVNSKQRMTEKIEEHKQPELVLGSKTTAIRLLVRNTFLAQILQIRPLVMMQSLIILTQYTKQAMVLKQPKRK